MTDWTDGYVTNTEYTMHFYPFLAPAAQNFALLLAGFAPLDLSGGYTYCELGCGHGYTTALLAASNPDGKFWGVDFNPAHVAGANKLKANAGIANVTYLEKSFAELTSVPDLPAFDFIALHGVWSWINAANRDAIMAFIYAKLKPGGVVYNSYNTLPGWSSLAPVRQLLVESQRHKTEINAAAVDDALALAQKLSDLKAGYFQANPAGTKIIEQLAKGSRNYLLHEYFNRDWVPFYFSDVAGDLKSAKLSFTCSSDIVEQMDQLCLTAEAQAVLKEQNDPIARETIRDFFRNTRFRRDLFSRGAHRLSQQERAAALQKLKLVLTSQTPTLPMQVNVPVGSAKLQGEPATAMINLLAKQPTSIPQLLADPEIGKHGQQAVFQVLMIMAARGLIAPVMPEAGDAARRASTVRFNRAVLMQTAGLESQNLASPVLGNGMLAPRLDQFILSLGPSLTAERLLQEAKARGFRLHQAEGNGQAPVDSIESVSSVLDQFRSQRLPVYKRLGVVA